MMSYLHKVWFWVFSLIKKKKKHYVKISVEQEMRVVVSNLIVNKV